MTELLLSLTLAFQMFPGPGTPHAAGSTGAWTLIAHTKQPATGSTGTVIQTSPINCTGANFYYVAAISLNAAPTEATYTVGGTGTSITNTSLYAYSAASVYIQAYWAANVTGNAAVSFSARTDYGPVFASCWSGAATSSVIDQESPMVLSFSCYPCSPSLTPTADGTLALMLGGIDSGTATSLSAAPGYTVLDSLAGTPGVSFGGQMFYKVLGASGTLETATITAASGEVGTAKMLNFKHQ